MIVTDSQPSIDVDGSDRAARRPRMRKAVVYSIIFHLGLILVLLFWYLPTPNSSGSGKASGTAQASADSGQEPSRPVPPSAPDPVSVPPEQIEKSLEAQIRDAEELTDEQKLTELEKNLRRLESISSPQSVQEVTSTIAGTIGVDQQQYATGKTPAEGSFDDKTAQLQDIVRTRDDSGTWQYESVLVDAQGRTMQVPMDEAEGASVYQTFQQMKKYPMAEGIYRGVVMPLIQRMIEAEEAAQRAALEAERMKLKDAAAQTSESRRPEQAVPRSGK